MSTRVTCIWRTEKIYSPQFGSFVRTSSAGSGSGVMTSSPAAKMVPFFSASTKSFCTTIPANWKLRLKIELEQKKHQFFLPPRATLMNTDVFFILLNADRSIKFFVSSFNGQDTNTKSDRVNSSSSDTKLAPSCLPKWNTMKANADWKFQLSKFVAMQYLLASHDGRYTKMCQFWSLWVVWQFPVQCCPVRQRQRLIP